MRILLSALNLHRAFAGCTVAFTLTLAASAQSAVTQQIDETRMVPLVGNVRPEANAVNDRGPVGDTLPLEHLQLALNRPALREAALAARMERMQTPGAAEYHQWLTPQQLGEQYGPEPADIATVTDWLQSHGFQVKGGSPSGMRVDFSGTAGQVSEAFRTEIHALEVRGQSHFANMQDPQVPAALAPLVAGIVSLNDFKPHPARTPVSRTPSPAYTAGSDTQLVTPGDLQTIYNFKPLLQAGTAGQGQRVFVLEHTNLYSNQDYYTFRKTFGLDAYKGSFSVEHPGGCKNPGVLVGDDGEAAIDVEWAAAAAPAAEIVLASCADSATSFGPLTALEGLLDHPNWATVVSLSYTEPESDLGAAGNLHVYHLFQQAAAEGVSIYVSSGDAGAAADSQNEGYATKGIDVNGFASTPFNLAAGGTDFADTYLQETSKFWSSANSASDASAKSYIPEIPWDDSCANSLITKFLGYTTPYGSKGACNSPLGSFEYMTTAAGGGGASKCAYGTASTPPETNGTCRGYAKPGWQKGLAGVPDDNLRDLPDVSLFAGNGIWGHSFVVCYSDVAGGGAPCTGSPAAWASAGGTSFVSPILAGVQALVNQSLRQRQGNPNYVYYALAHADYGTAGNTQCSSLQGEGACIFHDVTLGDIDVACTGAVDCYRPSGMFGVLSKRSSVYTPTYPATTGWDFATGIGTIDVTRLVHAWSKLK